MEGLQEVYAALTRVPRLRGIAASQATVERLAGLTNRNYKIVIGNERFVLRIPGEGTSEYIDRRQEAVAAHVAAEAGVNAEVLFFDESDGLMLTRFVDGAVTMNGERFKDLGAVARAARAFRRVHDCGRQFATEFDLFRKMDEYLDYLRKKQARIPEGYADVQKEAEAVRAALNARPAALRPCHCDPLAENFLDTGARIFIIDWEYAGNNDPMWDLGDVSVEAGFGPDQDAALLDAYFGGKPPAAQAGRMVMYKAMCDLLWTLWGVIQVVNQNPVDDFWAYAVNRFDRCKTLMGSPAFGPHLDAVRRG
ncbi:MAG TPA: choline kinase family protein [Candidatus Acidoferrum sp.]|nr:choline kinase family protein [Candidatus Acidoferrum sp.]